MKGEWFAGGVQMVDQQSQDLPSHGVTRSDGLPSSRGKAAYLVIEMSISKTAML